MKMRIGSFSSSDRLFLVSATAIVLIIANVVPLGKAEENNQKNHIVEKKEIKGPGREMFFPKDFEEVAKSERFQGHRGNYDDTDEDDYEHIKTKRYGDAVAKEPAGGGKGGGGGEADGADGGPGNGGGDGGGGGGGGDGGGNTGSGGSGGSSGADEASDGTNAKDAEKKTVGKSNMKTAGNAKIQEDSKDEEDPKDGLGRDSRGTGADHDKFDYKSPDYHKSYMKALHRMRNHAVSTKRRRKGKFDFSKLSHEREVMDLRKQKQKDFISKHGRRDCERNKSPVLLLVKQNENGEELMKKFDDEKSDSDDGVPETMDQILSMGNNYVVLKKIPEPDGYHKFMDSTFWNELRRRQPDEFNIRYKKKTGTPFNRPYYVVNRRPFSLVEPMLRGEYPLDLTMDYTYDYDDMSPIKESIYEDEAVDRKLFMLPQNERFYYPGWRKKSDGMKRFIRDFKELPESQNLVPSSKVQKISSYENVELNSLDKLLKDVSGYKPEEHPDVGEDEERPVAYVPEDIEEDDEKLKRFQKIENRNAWKMRRKRSATKTEKKKSESRRTKTEKEKTRTLHPSSVNKEKPHAKPKAGTYVVRKPKSKNQEAELKGPKKEQEKKPLTSSVERKGKKGKRGITIRVLKLSDSKPGFELRNGKHPDGREERHDHICSEKSPHYYLVEDKSLLQALCDDDEDDDGDGDGDRIPISKKSFIPSRHLERNLQNAYFVFGRIRNRRNAKWNDKLGAQGYDNSKSWGVRYPRKIRRRSERSRTVQVGSDSTSLPNTTFYRAIPGGKVKAGATWSGGKEEAEEEKPIAKSEREVESTEKDGENVAGNKRTVGDVESKSKTYEKAAQPSEKCSLDDILTQGNKCGVKNPEIENNSNPEKDIKPKDTSEKPVLATQKSILLPKKNYNPVSFVPVKIEPLSEQVVGVLKQTSLKGTKRESKEATTREQKKEKREESEHGTKPRQDNVGKSLNADVVIQNTLQDFAETSSVNGHEIVKRDGAIWNDRSEEKKESAGSRATNREMESFNNDYKAIWSRRRKKREAKKRKAPAGEGIKVGHNLYRRYVDTRFTKNEKKAFRDYGEIEDKSEETTDEGKLKRKEENPEDFKKASLTGQPEGEPEIRSEEKNGFREENADSKKEKAAGNRRMNNKTRDGIPLVSGLTKHKTSGNDEEKPKQRTDVTVSVISDKISDEETVDKFKDAVDDYKVAEAKQGVNRKKRSASEKLGGKREIEDEASLLEEFLQTSFGNEKGIVKKDEAVWDEKSKRDIRRKQVGFANNRRKRKRKYYKQHVGKRKEKAAKNLKRRGKVSFVTGNAFENVFGEYMGRGSKMGKRLTTGHLTEKNFKRFHKKHDMAMRLVRGAKESTSETDRKKEALLKGIRKELKTLKKISGNATCLKERRNCVFTYGIEPRRFDKSSWHKVDSFDKRNVVPNGPLRFDLGNSMGPAKRSLFSGNRIGVPDAVINPKDYIPIPNVDKFPSLGCDAEYGCSNGNSNDSSVNYGVQISSYPGIGQKMSVLESNKMNSVISKQLGEKIVDAIFARVEATPKFKQVLGPGLSFSKSHTHLTDMGAAPPLHNAIYARQIKKLLQNLMLDLEKLAEQDMRRRTCGKITSEQDRFLHSLLTLPVGFFQEPFYKKHYFAGPEPKRPWDEEKTDRQEPTDEFQETPAPAAESCEDGKKIDIVQRRCLLLQLIHDYNMMSAQERLKAKPLYKYILSQLEEVNRCLGLSKGCTNDRGSCKSFRRHHTKGKSPFGKDDTKDPLSFEFKHGPNEILNQIQFHMLEKPAKNKAGELQRLGLGDAAGLQIRGPSRWVSNLDLHKTKMGASPPASKHTDGSFEKWLLQSPFGFSPLKSHDRPQRDENPKSKTRRRVKRDLDEFELPEEENYLERTMTDMDEYEEDPRFEYYIWNSEPEARKRLNNFDIEPSPRFWSRYTPQYRKLLKRMAEEEEKEHDEELFRRFDKLLDPNESSITDVELPSMIHGFRSGFAPARENHAKTVRLSTYKWVKLLTVDREEVFGTEAQQQQQQ